MRLPLPLLGVLLGCASPVTAPTKAAVGPRPPAEAHAAGELLPVPAYLTATRIVALATGTLLVIDADSGALVKTDRDGAPVAHVGIGRDAGLLAYDPDRGLAFVADRTGDRLVVVDVATLRITRAWRTPAEPFGVALTPDRASVLVTTTADRALVAYDARSGAEQWRTALSVEPRGLAVSPDGTRALVTVGAGALDEISLGAAHEVTPITLDLSCDHCADGPAFARGSAVTFLDQHRAIASFQRAVPEALGQVRPGVYGGSSMPPVTQHLSFLSFSPTRGQAVAQVVANQPRALLWDRTRDTLYVAGLASDSLLQLAGLTSQTTDDVGHATFVLRPSSPCGPDGLAQAHDGAVFLWCSFSRSVLRLPGFGDALHEGPPVTSSSLTPEQHDGLVLFNGVHVEINRDRALACATCHTDGRADGLSWKIKAQTLQTPSLAGRLVGTAPYKWDGSNDTLEGSIATTVGRLGGSGLEPAQTRALIAYLAAVPRAHSPSLDCKAVARGKALFEGAAGCAGCHRGPQYTDGAQHHFASTLEHADTPSLVGVAASAPYYHDGSARSLDVLLRGGGEVHGMAKLEMLTDAERADLAAFLSSL